MTIWNLCANLYTTVRLSSCAAYLEQVLDSVCRAPLSCRTLACVDGKMIDAGIEACSAAAAARCCTSNESFVLIFNLEAEKSVNGSESFRVGCYYSHLRIFRLFGGMAGNAAGAPVKRLKAEITTVAAIVARVASLSGALPFPPRRLKRLVHARIFQVLRRK